MSHYGTILQSTPDEILRLVVTSGSVTIQTLKIAQEITLTTEDVGAVLKALGAEMPSHRKCEVCGVCLACTGCECLDGAADVAWSRFPRGLAHDKT